MKKVFKNKLIINILALALVDMIIGCFLLINHSFSRLAIWNIIEFDKEDSFYWKPQDAPEYFHFEPDSEKLSIFKNEISPLVKDENDGLKKAVKVAKYVGNIRAPRSSRTVGLAQWDSPEGILRQIRTGSSGHCYHYSILYSTYLSSIGMNSRVWALEDEDKFGRVNKHAVTEVYIKGLKKWVLIDATWGIYCTKNDYPLSVLELRDEILGGMARKILVHSVSERSYNPNLVIERYSRLLKRVFLRTGNDFVHRYDAGVRYAAFSRFQEYLDRLPSLWRRGLSCFFGRQDFMMHYIDKFSRSLMPRIIIAKAFFYFFMISSTLIFVFFLIIPVFKILRKHLAAKNLSKKDTRHK